MRKVNSMKAVILAAGEGKRMYPLTANRPKCMLYAAGKPLIWHTVKYLEKAGIKEIIVVVKYKKEKIIDFFEKEKNLKVNLKFIEQKGAYGTANAIYSAKNYIDDNFIALAGDVVFDYEDLKKLKECDEDTVLAKKVKSGSGFGVLETAGNRIKKVYEKPEHYEKECFINTSIYLFTPKIFEKLKNVKKSIRNEYEVTDVLNGLKFIEASGFWLDVGYAWQLFEAQDFLFSKVKREEIKNEGKIENSTVKGKLITEKNVHIFDSYIDEGFHYIGEETKIGPHAYLRGNNTIGKFCDIGESTTVKNSIIFDHVKAKHLNYIGDSIIGENVNFGAGTQIANFRFDEQEVKVYFNNIEKASGRKKLGAIVGDNTKFGVLSAVMPGKIIGNNCWIGPGVIVESNVESGKKVFLKQEKIIK